MKVWRGGSVRRGPLAIAVGCGVLALLVGLSIFGIKGNGPFAGHVHSSFPYLGSGNSPPSASSGLEGEAGGVAGLPGASAQPGAAGPGGAKAPGGARAPGAAGGPGLPVGPTSKAVGGTPAPGQAPIPGPCVPSVQTDRAAYPKGATINMAVVVVNGSTAPCNIPAGPGAPTFYVADASGKQIWGGCDAPDGTPHACANPAATQALAPNGVFTSSQTWNQQRPAGPGAKPSQVAPGTYTVGYGKPGSSYGSTITISG